MLLGLFSHRYPQPSIRLIKCHFLDFLEVMKVCPSPDGDFRRGVALVVLVVAVDGHLLYAHLREFRV
jgi:hypothetical protein